MAVTKDFSLNTWLYLPYYKAKLATMKLYSGLRHDVTVLKLFKSSPPVETISSGRWNSVQVSPADGVKNDGNSVRSPCQKLIELEPWFTQASIMDQVLRAHKHIR